MSIAKEVVFRKTKCLAIFKDNKTERPIVSFGLKKAVAVVKHLSEIKAFIKRESSSSVQPEETDEQNQ